MSQLHENGCIKFVNGGGDFSQHGYHSVVVKFNWYDRNMNIAQFVTWRRIEDVAHIQDDVRLKHMITLHGYLFKLRVIILVAFVGGAMLRLVMA